MAVQAVAQRFGSTSTRSSALNLKGIIVALTTPFDSDQRIDFDKMKHNLDIYEKIPLTGYLTTATNGEAPFLTPDERVQVVKFVREHTDKSKMVIGCSTAESTRLCAEMTTAMSNVGADGVLVMPPFYFKGKMTEEAILTHYRTVAETSGLPIVVYNNSKVTGMDISTSTLAKLAQHPLIRGVKDSDVRKCAATAQETKSLNFDVLCSSAGYLLPALVNGCSGSMNGLAGILGQECCDLYSAYQEGKFEKAREIQARLIKPDILVLGELGPPGLKSAMDMMGYFGGHCRRPILPISEEDKLRITEVLREAGYL
uniref:Putative 4-hydroxy-2-oxoglutarate aldolase, mitochondrial n=1 Tax=Lygus hesperus TaxID=30085 RepID=A0A0A9WZE8_LYGHE